jgi:hypothetical protein
MSTSRRKSEAPDQPGPKLKPTPTNPGKKPTLLDKLPPDLLSVMAEYLTEADLSNAASKNPAFGQLEVLGLNDRLPSNLSELREVYPKLRQLTCNFEVEETDALNILRNFKGANRPLRLVIKSLTRVTHHLFSDPLIMRMLSIDEMAMDENFDQPIGPGVLPKSLKSLTFGIDFSQPIGSYLRAFGGRFNQAIIPGVLPKSLKSLNLGWEFNLPIGPGVLPESLESLTFGADFNKPIILGVLPKSLKSMTFGQSFNHPIGVGVLPESLESLIFGADFNKPIKLGVLPESLKILTFGDSFNQQIHPGVLPNSLTSLTFSMFFNEENIRV